MNKSPRYKQFVLIGLIFQITQHCRPNSERLVEKSGKLALMPKGFIEYYQQVTESVHNYTGSLEISHARATQEIFNADYVNSVLKERTENTQNAFKVRKSEKSLSCFDPNLPQPDSEFPQANCTNAISDSLEIKLVTNRIASFLFIREMYEGGPHPGTWEIGITINLLTKSEISLKSILLGRSQACREAIQTEYKALTAAHKADQEELTDDDIHGFYLEPNAIIFLLWETFGHANGRIRLKVSREFCPYEG